MESTKKEILHTETTLPQDRLLHVNLSFRSNIMSISEPDDEVPLYVVHSGLFSSKMVFKTGPSAAKALKSGAKIESLDLDDEKDIIGITKFKFFSNSFELHIRERPVTLSPSNKRLDKFQYPSTAFAASPDVPETMYWHLQSKVMSLGFQLELRDENDQMVAKFNTRNKEEKKSMTLEMFGPKAWDSLAAEEVIVTGLTVFVAIMAN